MSVSNESVGVAAQISSHADACSDVRAEEMRTTCSNLRCSKNLRYGGRSEENVARGEVAYDARVHDAPRPDAQRADALGGVSSGAMT